MSDETQATASTSECFVMPEGRGINLHIFQRQVYKSEKGGAGDPKYSVEMVYPRPTSGADDVLRDFEDYIWNCLVEKYGEETVKAHDNAGTIRWPIKDGDKKKARREAKGKPGDAYGGMNVVSASSLFNFEGNPSDGGIEVLDEAVKTIEPVNQGKVYNGCFGIVALKAKPYEGSDAGTDTDFISCALYLEAFQKTGEGEKLMQVTSRSNLFQKRSADKDESTTRNARRTRS